MYFNFPFKGPTRVAFHTARILVCAICIVCHTVSAETLEEGQAAYQAQDYEKAYAILKPLAEAGNPNAQIAIGLMYDKGHGVPEDSSEAVVWYERAASQGLTVVQQELGFKYFRGEGIPADYERAAYWWGQAAEGGLAESQFNLGLLYSRGLGVNQDDLKASQWFEKAARQDHGHAQYSLGVMYARGRGVANDYPQAATWFLKASHKGIPQAQYNLGLLLENGQGVKKNPDSAIKLYRLAADQGLPEAKERLAELEPIDVTVSTEPSPPSPAPAPEPEPAPVAAVATASANNEGAIKGAAWVNAQDPQHYTIQLLSVSSEDDLVTYLERQALGSDVAYVKRRHKGGVLYTAIYGIFDTRASALEGRERLPDSIRKDNPWIRRFGDLQALILP